MNSTLEQRTRDAYLAFHETFDCAMTYEQFAYKHLKNPAMRDDSVFFNDYEQDTVRGTNAFTDLTLLVDGTAFPAVHSCDTAVRAAYRGQHLFTHILQRAMAEFSAGSTALILCTPNENSYPGFQKLGFQEIGKVRRYVSVLRPLHLLARKRLGRSTPLSPFVPTAFTDSAGRQWQASAQCPFSTADFAQMNDRPGIHLLRTADFFRWKLDENPLYSFSYLTVYQQGSLLGYFVVWDRGDGSCTLCDWMLPSQSGEQQALLKGVRTYLRRLFDLVQLSFLNPISEAPLFAACGFRPRGADAPLLFYPTVRPEDTLLPQSLWSPEAWALREIDFDGVLTA